jgi:hypothetical protein
MTFLQSTKTSRQVPADSRLFIFDPHTLYLLFFKFMNFPSGFEQTVCSQAGRSGRAARKMYERDQPPAVQNWSNEEHIKKVIRFRH